MKILIYHTKSNFMNFRIKSLLVLLITILSCLTPNAQNLTISTSDPIISSGTNWNLVKNETSVTITFTKQASIHPNLIEDFLNKGKSVTLISDGDIKLDNSIQYVGHLPKVKLTLISKNNGSITFGEHTQIISRKSQLDVHVKTEGQITIPSSSGIYTKGGNIRLQALEFRKSKKNPVTKIEILGTLNASDEIGGKIILEADAIELQNSAKLISKGNYGGGIILVGGDWQGGKQSHKKEPEDIYEAITVQMDNGAIIDASAMENGNGGKVVLWSSLNHPLSNTSVQGQIFAMGKGNGKGGMIETSGGEISIYGSKISTLATDGSAGEWLIDPFNLYFNTSDLSTIATNLNTNNIYHINDYYIILLYVSVMCI
jgi:hypothetical protein